MSLPVGQRLVGRISESGSIPDEWAVGTEYCVVRIVSHRASDGTHDPQIHERICLPSESRVLIANSMARNPYATAYVDRTATWRGLHAG